MKTIKQILIERDGMTPEQADLAIQECKEEFYQRIEEGDMEADNVLMDHFGLEPDYIDELLEY